MGWYSWDDFVDDVSDVGGGIYDYLTGAAAKEAANATAASQAAQAEAYRTQAKETLAEGKTALENYVADSNQALSSVVNKIAAAGGIGFKQTETVTEGSTGVDVGSADSEAVTTAKEELATALGTYSSVDEMQTAADTLNKRIQELEGGLFLTDEDRAELTSAQTELSGLSSSLKKAKQLQNTINTASGSELGNDLSTVADVTATQDTGAKYATGSTLANINTFRDELQQARNTYARGIQSDVYSLLTAAENYDAAAAATRRVGEISQWDTILGRGLQIVGLGLSAI